MTDSPFELLGLPQTYDLDPEQIRRAYLTRSAQAHPDLVGEAEDAQDLASSLNAARDTLENPERRAEALLGLVGGPSTSDDTALPEGYLMEIMQVRQQVEEDLAPPEQPGQREHWQAWAETRRAEHESRVAAFFAEPEPPRGDIRRELNAWRYIERLIEQLDPEYDPKHADFRRP